MRNFARKYGKEIGLLSFSRQAMDHISDAPCAVDCTTTSDLSLSLSLSLSLKDTVSITSSDLVHLFRSIEHWVRILPQPWNVWLASFHVPVQGWLSAALMVKFS